MWITPKTDRVIRQKPKVAPPAKKMLQLVCHSIVLTSSRLSVFGRECNRRASASFFVVGDAARRT